MTYDVRMSDVDAVGSWVLAYASAVGGQVQSMMQAAQGIVELDGFQGAAAENVKAYWGEAHMSVLAAISTALQEVAVRYALYMGNYSAIDGSGSGVDAR